VVDPGERKETLKRLRGLCLVLPETSWDELAGIAEDAYAEVAPPKLVERARLAG